MCYQIYGVVVWKQLLREPKMVQSITLSIAWWNEDNHKLARQASCRTGTTNNTIYCCINLIVLGTIIGFLLQVLETFSEIEKLTVWRNLLFFEAWRLGQTPSVIVRECGISNEPWNFFIRHLEFFGTRNIKWQKEFLVATVRRLVKGR